MANMSHVSRFYDNAITPIKLEDLTATTRNKLIVAIPVHVAQPGPTSKKRHRYLIEIVNSQ